jgi:hypothetical protein
VPVGDTIYRVSQDDRSMFWEVAVILSKKSVYVHVSYSLRFQKYNYFTVQFQIVDKKEILRTVSNTGVYCSSGKVGTVYLV